MWIVAALILSVMFIASALPAVPQFLLSLGVNIFMGLHGNDLLGWSLKRRGLSEIALSNGGSLEEAELRFYADGVDAPALRIANAGQPRCARPLRLQKLNAMKVAIIDYGSGNLHSALKAFERAAGASGQITVTADPNVVRKAERIVLPGVGAFKDCYEGLMAVPGMRDTLQEQVIARGKPFLGICVGMQLMATRGLEHDITPGLGWIAGDVKLITPANGNLKIPHMGWNTLDVKNPHALLDGIALGENGLHAYFVHSYQLEATLPEDVVATTDYAGPITAMVGYDNLAGTQFHPEKSQALGLALIANFLRWKP